MNYYSNYHSLSNYDSTNYYSSPNADLILKKTNQIAGSKLTEFPQYKSALSKDVKFQMAKMDASQLTNILTKDVDNSLQTMKNITDNNVSFRYKHGF